jgi:tripartite-type tricarboxylate transporter receptor subunit TctC
MSRQPQAKQLILFVVLAVVTLMLIPLAGCSTAAAPSYPSRPIELIAPYAPGGGTDTSARLLASYASKKLGQPVQVVNVTGASGITGSLQMLNAAADGYTLLMDGVSNTTFLVGSRSDVPFKLEERTWLGQWFGDPMYYMYNADTPFKTLNEAMDFAKSKPSDYTWGAGAQSSMSMFHGLTLLVEAGIDPKQTKMVVFPEGMAPSVQAALAGTVMHAGAMATDVEKLLPTGKVKILAVAANERTKEYPDVPTTKELGYPNANLLSWYGVSGPKGLPKEVVDRWAKLMDDASKDPEFLAESAKQKKVPSFVAPSEQQSHVLKEADKIRTLSQQIGIYK